MKKSKLTFLQTKIIAIVGCVIITIICGTAVSFSILKCGKYQNKISINQSQIESLKNDADNYRKLIGKYEVQKKKLREILFTDRDVSSFLEGISRVAKKSHIKISEMKTRRFKKVKPAGTATNNTNSLSGKSSSNSTEDETLLLAAIPIDVRIKGKFSSIVDFLIFLEEYRQLITLSNIGIEIKKYPFLKCSFILRLYSLKSIQELKEVR